MLPINTNEELTKINGFLLSLLQASNSGRTKMVYRGDKITDLFDKLNVPYHNDMPDYSQVLSRLFMLGEKGKYFYNNRLTGDRGNIIQLDDVDERAFVYIFTEMSKVAKSKKLHHVDFFKDNTEFRAYFTDITNKHHFLKTSEKYDRHKKLGIKRYYLTLLHQLAAVNYKKKSVLVSASEDIEVARQFAGHSIDKPAFLLHVWVPTFRTLRSYFNDLPLYRQPPFKKQKEVSFFAGILPHYIVGLELIGERIMFYNPAIQYNEITFESYMTGLYIDQTKFEDVLKQTNYVRSYSTDGRDYIEN